MAVLLQNTPLSSREHITLNITDANWYLIKVTAKVKSEKQRGKNETDDEELIIKIDDTTFPKFGIKQALFNSPAAFNGGELHNREKTVYFLTRLQKGGHTITLTPQYAAEVIEVSYEALSLTDNQIKLPLNQQSEERDRKPWITFVLVDTPIQSCTLEATVRWHWFDGDDIKVIANGTVQKNSNARFRKNWLFAARPILDIFGRTQKETLQLDLPEKPFHYIELFADKTPTLNEIIFEMGNRPIQGKVALYQDIEQTDFVNLRKTPDHTEEENIIMQLKDGEDLTILEERVRGSYVINKSDIWHKVEVNRTQGYLLSSFVEIERQERETIINKISKKTYDLGMDEHLLRALAGCESRYKPYAVSAVQAKGIFQLTHEAMSQLKKEGFGITDPFIPEQNIEGGVRYFKWLLETYYEGTSQEIEKTIAAYNWGQGNVPADKPLDTNTLPEETASLIECVQKNRNKKDWHHIVIPLFFGVIYLMGIAGHIVSFQDNKNVLATSTLNIEYKTIHEACPSIKRAGDTTITLVDTNCLPVRNLTHLDLDIAGVFNLSEEKINEDRFLIHPGDEIVESTTGVIYFFVSNTSFCGMQNCTYALYAYDRHQDSLHLVSTDFFGTITKAALSPDEQKIAIVRVGHSSVCDERSSLHIVSLPSGERKKIVGLEDEALKVMYIDDIQWISDGFLRISSSHTAGCNPESTIVQYKVIVYDVATGESVVDKLKEFDAKGG